MLIIFVSYSLSFFNSSAVKEQKRIIEIKIQELRTTINNHLDKLQDDLMKELTEAEKQVTEETREHFQHIRRQPLILLYWYRGMISGRFR
jgi:TRAP-type C4-dicarboxylate transport system substrate-binding protein